MRVDLPGDVDGKPSPRLGPGEPAQREIEATSSFIGIHVAQLGSVGHGEISGAQDRLARASHAHQNPSCWGAPPRGGAPPEGSDYPPDGVRSKRLKAPQQTGLLHFSEVPLQSAGWRDVDVIRLQRAVPATRRCTFALA